MALVPLLGTQLRAGDDAEIMADDLSPCRKAYAGLVTVAALTYDAHAGTTLSVQYVHMLVVTVAPADLDPRGDAARRIARQLLTPGVATSRSSMRFSSVSAVSAASAASLRVGVLGQRRRALLAEQSSQAAEDESKRLRTEAEAVRLDVQERAAVAKVAVASADFPSNTADCEHS